MDRPATPDSRVRFLVEKHLDTVWRTLRRLGVPERSTDDAAQKVFMVVARRLQEIEIHGERRYLLGVTWRVAADARRALYHEEVPMDPVEADTSLGRSAVPQPDEALERKQALAFVATLLDEMPAGLRDAFVLFDLEDRQAQEVARILDIPVGTVASRVRRARAHIRESLESSALP
jgi:RNA polymerase sigma-70 factor (ECF subfamily)